MTNWLPAASADLFQLAVDGMIRDHGGPGSLGQFIVRFEHAVDLARLRAGLARLARRHPLLLATPARRRAWPGWRLRLGRTAEMEQAASAETVAAQHLHSVQSDLLRLAVAPRAVVCTFDHRRIDARGAALMLAALDQPATPRDLASDPTFRELAGLPPGAAALGCLARTLLPALRPLRQSPPWRPPLGAAAPLQFADGILAGTALARVTARQTAMVGRFGETAFLMGAWARVLDRHGAAGRLQVHALAMDDRRPGEAVLAANRHSLALLGLAAGARGELASAAKAAAAAQRAWLSAGADRAMAAALRFTPFLSQRLVRAQLGDFHGGLSASTLIANSGVMRLPTNWLGGTVLGIDHRATLPHRPGLALFTSRDPRGWCLTVGRAGATSGWPSAARLLSDLLAELDP